MNKCVKCTFGGLENYITLAIHGKTEVSINTSDQQLQTIRFPGLFKVFAMDEWLIQYMDKRIYIASIEGESRAKELFLQFKSLNPVDVDLTAHRGGRSHTESLSQAKMMRIRREGIEGIIDVVLEKAIVPPEQTSTPQSESTLQPEIIPEPALESKDHSRVTQLSEQLRQAEARNQALTEENQTLRHQLSEGAEQYIHALREHNADCNDALSHIVSEATKLEREADDIERQTNKAERQCAEQKSRLQQAQRSSTDAKKEIEEVSKQIEAIQQQSLERINLLEEFSNLDSDRIRAELDDQRARLLEDSDVQALLEDDPVLKVVSVAGALEKVGKTLDSVEKKLGLIISLREKIDNAVRDTILRGDGTIASQIETGDGDGGLG